MLRIGLFLMTNAAVLVIASISLNLLGVGSYLDETGTGLNLTSLLIFCGIFGFAGAFVSLFISKWIAKWSTKAKVIDQPTNEQEKWLVDTVAELAKKADIGMPDVAIFPSQQSNAYATGWNKNSALVAVSAGMLSRFERDEVRAVMAHEIGHVANGDMITMTLIQGIVNTFVMFFARIIGHTVDRVILKNNRGHGIGYYVATFISEIILAFLANMIVAWFSRQREFRADYAGAKFGDKGSMIRALQRLQAESRQRGANQMPDTMAAFGICSAMPSNMRALFSTHPPLDVRIAALEKL